MVARAVEPCSLTLKMHRTLATLQARIAQALALELRRTAYDRFSELDDEPQEREWQ